jgi:hypothetical protein
MACLALDGAILGAGHAGEGREGPGRSALLDLILLLRAPPGVVGRAFAVPRPLRMQDNPCSLPVERPRSSG